MRQIGARMASVARVGREPMACSLFSGAGGFKRRQQRELAATVGADRAAISPPGIGTATDDDGSVASPAPLTRTQARGAAAVSLL